jgi:hypothetical protein
VPGRPLGGRQPEGPATGSGPRPAGGTFVQDAWKILLSPRRKNAGVSIIPRRGAGLARRTPAATSRDPGRGARSLPEGRRRAPRERSDCTGSGERSRRHPTSLAVRSLPRREPPPSLRLGDYSRRELLGDGGPNRFCLGVRARARGVFRGVRAYARGARSLPEGRRRAPRERSGCAGSGERSRPHPTSLAVRSLPRREPPPSLRLGDYSRRELLGDGRPSSSVSVFDRGTGNVPRRLDLRSRRAKSPRGEEARAAGAKRLRGIRRAVEAASGRAARRCAEGADSAQARSDVRPGMSAGIQPGRTSRRTSSSRRTRR